MLLLSLLGDLVDVLTGRECRAQYSTSPDQCSKEYYRARVVSVADWLYVAACYGYGMTIITDVLVSVCSESTYNWQSRTRDYLDVVHMSICSPLILRKAGMSSPR